MYFGILYICRDYLLNEKVPQIIWMKLFNRKFNLIVTVDTKKGGIHKFKSTLLKEIVLKSS